MSSTLAPAAASLARQARERFVAHREGVLQPLGEAVHTALIEQMNTAKSSRDMHHWRDALVEFEKDGKHWPEATARAAVPPSSAATRSSRTEQVGLPMRE